MSTLYDYIDAVFKDPVPEKWKTSPSGYYVYAILNKIRDTPDGSFEYTKVAETIMAALKQKQNKDKINADDLKTLLLKLVKLDFLRFRPKPDLAIVVFTYYNKYSQYYNITTSEIIQQYYTAFPPALTKAQMKKIQKDVDNLMFILTVTTYNHLAGPGEEEEKLYYLDEIFEKNFYKLLPIFRYYGYPKFVQDYDFVLDSSRMIDNWIAEDQTMIFGDTPRAKAGFIIKQHNDKQIVLTTLSDGSVYQGPQGGIQMAEQNIFRRRATQTLENITGGIFGALGYEIGGDKGSDIGAICDNLFQAAGQGFEHAQQLKSIQLAPSRAQVTDYMSRQELAELRSPEGTGPGAGPSGEVSGLEGARGTGAARAPVVTEETKGTTNPMTEAKGTSFLASAPAIPSTQQLTKLVEDARKFYEKHGGAVGQFMVPGEKPIPIKSGEDAGAVKGTAAGGFPRGEGYGFSAGGPSQGNIVTHVEGHSAAIMWQRKLKYAQLVVDRPPCSICARNIPYTLPPGATLEVFYKENGVWQREIYRSSHGY